MHMKFWLVFGEPTGDASAERPDAGDAQQSERRAEYDRLVREVYKDLYTEDTQKMINRRFREFKELEERLLESEKRLAALSAPPDLTGPAQAFKAENPDFDLELELENPEFAALARSGIPLAACWKAVHLEDVIEKAATAAREEAARGMARGTPQNAPRPLENGMAASRGLAVRNSASTLTRRQRSELAARALRGERVVL